LFREKREQQPADRFRLFLLHPMTSAPDQVRAAPVGAGFGRCMASKAIVVPLGC
jgi:hypothetical protein